MILQSLNVFKHNEETGNGFEYKIINDDPYFNFVDYPNVWATITNARFDVQKNIFTYNIEFENPEDIDQNFTNYFVDSVAYYRYLDLMKLIAIILIGIFDDEEDDDEDAIVDDDKSVIE